MGFERLSLMHARLEDLSEWWIEWDTGHYLKEGHSTVIPQGRHLRSIMRSGERALVVILDAARVEVGGMIINVLEHHTDLDRYRFTVCYSPASNTFDWARRVFGGERWDNVTYYSGATPINSLRVDWSDHKDLMTLYAGWYPVDHIGRIEDLWDKCFDTEYYTTDPKCLAKTAAEMIDVAERLGTDGVDFVHFFQPHMPPARGAWTPKEYVPPKKIRKRKGLPPVDPPDAPFWDQVKKGNIPEWAARRTYYSNARVGIEDGLIPLLKSVAQYYERVVITADHGNCLGEHSVWGHPPSVRYRRWTALRLVPLVEVFP